MFLAVLFILIILLFCYDRKNKQYWSRRGVFSPASHFLFGHSFSFSVIEDFTACWQSMDRYYKLGKKYNFFGIYEMFTPKIVVTDPNLIKLITESDFKQFKERKPFNSISSENIISQSMLTHLRGVQGKVVQNANLRVFLKDLQPLFPLVQKEADNLRDIIHSKYSDGTSVNVVKLFEKYSFNVLQSCLMGTSTKKFEEKMELFSDLQNTLSVNKDFICKLLVSEVFPSLFQLLNLTFTTPSHERLYAHIKKVIADKRVNGSSKVDFISCMIEARKEGKTSEDVKGFSDDEILSEAVHFMAAGFDTVKSTLSFIFYHIAKYPNEQQMLRNDMKKHNMEHGQLNKNIKNLTYLEAFCLEVLRLHPTRYMMERYCTKDYKIPDTDVIIPKGMTVTIPTYSIHRDPRFWEDPNEFRPGRFFTDRENSAKFNYLPFGTGPRGCTGRVFALTQIKMAVIKILQSFEVLLLESESSLKIAKTFLAYRPHYTGVKVIFKKIKT